MPLNGTICCQSGKAESFEHCMNCALHGDPAPCQHPFPLIMAMRDNAKHREGAGLSTTTILGCMRFDVLKDDFDYQEDPDQFAARFKGTLIHAGLESYVPHEADIIAEQRYFRDIEVKNDATGEVELITISGKPDIILPDYQGSARIIDGKSGGRRKLYPQMQADESHQRQINIYRWIVADGRDSSGRRVSFDVGSLAIWYVGDSDLIQVEVDVASLDQVDSYIRGLLHTRAHQELPPILPSTYTSSRKTGQVTERRHWKCDRCPLRETCDTFPREGIVEGYHESTKYRKRDSE